MKTLNHIPTSKLRRALQVVKTGAQVGGNYAKYYTDRITQDQETAKEKLDQANAEDIYDGLKTLKGSALKVAQMMSMDKNVLPRAYVDKFSLSQFSVPPLSGPLVRKTFKKYFGKTPEELYDSFETESINAASIGQVHVAHVKGQKLAVKIQYPGVADSIESDLKLVRPFALRLLNLSGKDADIYFEEVKNKLLEETDYLNELEQSNWIKAKCAGLEGIVFPTYFPTLSCEKVITMEWMDGLHLSEYVQQEKSREKRTAIAQRLWNFYLFQLHELKKVHADPHPGNFLINSANELVALDFGCMKEIPKDFYDPYFALTNPQNLSESETFKKYLFELEVLKTNDTEKEIHFFENLFREMLSIFTLPFQGDTFDFSNPDFFQKLNDLGEKFSKDPELRKQDGGRGSKHFIYMNRTFFGLYNLMYDLKADSIEVNQYKNLLSNPIPDPIL